MLVRLGSRIWSANAAADLFSLPSPIFFICLKLQVEALAFWAQGAFDAFAMGNYPYPSSYMGGSLDHRLPAWPMREACRHMTRRHHSHTLTASDSSMPAGSRANWNAQTLMVAKNKASRKLAGSKQSGHMVAGDHGGGEAEAVLAGDGSELLHAFRDAVGVLYNATGSLECFSLDLSGPGAAFVGAHSIS